MLQSVAESWSLRPKGAAGPRTLEPADLWGKLATFVVVALLPCDAETQQPRRLERISGKLHALLQDGEVQRLLDTPVSGRCALHALLDSQASLVQIGARAATDVAGLAKGLSALFEERLLDTAGLAELLQAPLERCRAVLAAAHKSPRRPALLEPRAAAEGRRSCGPDRAPQEPPAAAAAGLCGEQVLCGEWLATTLRRAEPALCGLALGLLEAGLAAAIEPERDHKLAWETVDLEADDELPDDKEVGPSRLWSADLARQLRQKFWMGGSGTILLCDMLMAPALPASPLTRRLVACWARSEWLFLQQASAAAGSAAKAIIEEELKRPTGGWLKVAMGPHFEFLDPGPRQQKPGGPQLAASRPAAERLARRSVPMGWVAEFLSCGGDPAAVLLDKHAEHLEELWLRSMVEHELADDAAELTRLLARHATAAKPAAAARSAVARTLADSALLPANSYLREGSGKVQGRFREGLPANSSRRALLSVRTALLYGYVDHLAAAISEAPDGAARRSEYLGREERVLKRMVHKLPHLITELLASPAAPATAGGRGAGGGAGRGGGRGHSAAAAAAGIEPPQRVVEYAELCYGLAGRLLSRAAPVLASDTPVSLIKLLDLMNPKDAPRAARHVIHQELDGVLGSLWRIGEKDASVKRLVLKLCTAMLESADSADRAALLRALDQPGRGRLRAELLKLTLLPRLLLPLPPPPGTPQRPPSELVARCKIGLAALRDRVRPMLGGALAKPRDRAAASATAPTAPLTADEQQLACDALPGLAKAALRCSGQTGAECKLAEELYELCTALLRRRCALKPAAAAAPSLLQALARQERGEKAAQLMEMLATGLLQRAVGAMLTSCNTPGQRDVWKQLDQSHLLQQVCPSWIGSGPEPGYPTGVPEQEMGKWPALSADFLVPHDASKLQAGLLGGLFDVIELCAEAPHALQRVRETIADSLAKFDDCIEMHRVQTANVLPLVQRAYAEKLAPRCRQQLHDARPRAGPS